MMEAMLTARPGGASVYVRSQLRAMVLSAVDGAALLWHRVPLTGTHVANELLAFSRATHAVLPPAEPRGGGAPLPPEDAQAVGRFLNHAAKVVAVLSPSPAAITQRRRCSQMARWARTLAGHGAVAVRPVPQPCAVPPETASHDCIARCPARCGGCPCRPCALGLCGLTLG
jgi:hypothetical protein